jgi:hypothetical protein
VAFAAADFGFSYDFFVFPAEGIYIHLALDERERPLNFGTQLHMFTGVGDLDIGYRAGIAQVPGPFIPGGSVHQQAAFLPVSTSVIIPVKIFTFSSCRCAHFWIIACRNEKSRWI